MIPLFFVAIVSTVSYILPLFKPEFATAKWNLWMKESVDFGAVLLAPVVFAIFPFGLYIFSTVFAYLNLILYFALYCNPGVHHYNKKWRRGIFSIHMGLNVIILISVIIASNGNV